MTAAPADAPAPAPGARRLLVTGATGFLGTHLVHALLRGRPGAEAPAVLVRAATEEAGLGRMLAGLEQCAASYHQALDRDAAASLRVVVGDVTAPLCGVRPEALERTAAWRPRELWHLAASLSFEERRREEIALHNVEGTRNALELARRLGAERFVYVSTAYTAGSARGRVAEALHPASGPFNNCYEETKCRAEHEVAQACARSGMDFRILRPSVVVGPASTLRTGGSNSGLYGFCREIYRLREVLSELDHPLRLVGDVDVRLNHAPVDRVVADMLWLWERGFPGGPVYHLTSARNPLVKDEIALICTELGLRPLELGPREAPPSPLEKLLDRKTAFYGGYLKNEKVFDRSLPGAWTVTRDDLVGYVTECLRELRREDGESIFQRTAIRSFDGTPILAYAAGDPSLPPLALSNAYGMPVDFWVPLALALRDRFRIVTWETRGIPNVAADFAPERCAPEHHARDLLAVLDHYGLSKVKLVGWCTGAQVLLRFITLFPERAEAAVLLNGAYRLPDDVPVTDFQRRLGALLAKCARGVGSARLYSDLILGNRSGGGGGATEGDRTNVSAVVTSTDPGLLHMTSGPFRTPEALYRYGQLFLGTLSAPDHAWTEGVDLPVLVVSGLEDGIAHPAASREVARRIPRARLLMKERGDHFLLYHDPALASEIADFFASAGRAAA